MVTILQSDMAVKFVYPFLLIFFIVFAILEKTKIFGDDKKVINAWVAGVIALIFIAAVTPKLIVGNLVLFLSVAMIIIFVILLLWGFVSGGELKTGIFGGNKFLPWVVGIVIVLGVLIVVSISAGINVEGFFGKLFNSSWSESFWSNVLFIFLIAVALAVAVKSGVGGKSS
jgi:hypothetical protein